MTSVLVRCGGLGSRLGPAGAQRQKTMLELDGTPLLELVLSQACPAVPAPAPIVLLTGHRARDVETAVPGWRHRIDQRIRAIRENAPGPAGVLGVAAQLPAPIVLVSGNVVLPYSLLLPRLLRQWDRDGRPVVAGSSRWCTSRHHTVDAHAGTVTSWHRWPHREGGRYELLDAYLLTTNVLDLMRHAPCAPISHTRALAALVPGGTVAFTEFSGDWLHVETLTDLTVTPSRKAVLCPQQS
ncbi:NTP transferase domain-containing protein [Nocardia terpenica]|nr:NTP transferase domain-containing protein [Nocardia terpenica]NQE89546.1 NTP transferase domain-containing protein [Nocardia terpenica]